MGSIRSGLAVALLAGAPLIVGAKASGLTDAAIDAFDGGPENGGVVHVQLTSSDAVNESVFDAAVIGAEGTHQLYVLVPTEEGNYQMFHGDDPSEVLVEIGCDAVYESDGRGTMLIGERENFTSVTFPVYSAAEFFDLGGQEINLVN